MDIVEFWQVITLLLAFLGFLFAAGRLLLSQIDRRLVKRARNIGTTSSPQCSTRTVARPNCRCNTSTAKTTGQSVIEAKLDALYNKLEAVQMKGVNR